MNLGETHTQLSREINQGTRLDAYIPAYVRRAARFIERNYTFLYMQRFLTLSVDVDADEPNAIAWPLEESQSLLKSISFLRYQQDTPDQDWKYLIQTEPENIGTPTPSDGPSFYWLLGDPSGQGYLMLDTAGLQDLELQFKYNSYSAWPTDSEAEHWLLDNCEDLIISQSMIYLAPLAEEPAWVPKYKTMWELGIKSAINADMELRTSGHPAGYQTILR